MLDYNSKPNQETWGVIYTEADAFTGESHVDYDDKNPATIEEIAISPATQGK